MRARVEASGYVIAAFVAAAAAALVVAFAPLYEGCSATAQASSTSIGSVSEHVSCGHETALQVNGPWVLVIVAIPVLIALLPIALRFRRSSRIVSALVLWILCVLGALSIGVFFVPAAILMTIAAARSDAAPLPPIPVG